jgi:UDP-N-acetylmuramate-alanine ligase
VIYDINDTYSKNLDFTHTQAKPITLDKNGFRDGVGVYHTFPEMHLQVPGDHLLFDARLAFVVGKILGLPDVYITKRLESYRGCWRRSEIIRTTQAGNILISDYGHHPTEIRLTLTAIKEKYKDRKLFVAFQPHQHSRTRELLDEFGTSFDASDGLVISNIYFSRDNQEDVDYMTTQRLVDTLSSRYPYIQNGENLANTSQIIQQYDKNNPESAIIVLL